MFVQSVDRLHNAQQQLQKWGSIMFYLLKCEHTQEGSNDFGLKSRKYFWGYFEGPKKMIEMFDGGELKRCQIAMDCRKFWLEKPTFQRGKWKLSSPSYGSGLKEIWLNPDVSQPKWLIVNKVDLMELISDEESACFAMPLRLGQVADLGNEPLTSDDEEACFEDVWIP